MNEDISCALSCEFVCSDYEHVQEAAETISEEQDAGVTPLGKGQAGRYFTFLPALGAPAEPAPPAGVAANTETKAVSTAGKIAPQPGR